MEIRNNSKPPPAFKGGGGVVRSPIARKVLLYTQVPKPTDREETQDEENQRLILEYQRKKAVLQGIRSARPNCGTCGKRR